MNIRGGHQARPQNLDPLLDLRTLIRAQSCAYKRGDRAVIGLLRLLTVIPRRLRIRTHGGIEVPAYEGELESEPRYVSTHYAKVTLLPILPMSSHETFRLLSSIGYKDGASQRHAMSWHLWLHLCTR